MSDLKLKKFLEKNYKNYKFKNSSKDPVWIIHKFNNEPDIEIAGFITAAFTYGSVDQIIKFIDGLFKKIGNNVYEFTLNYSKSKDKKYLEGVAYRFQKSEDVILLFEMISNVLKSFGSLKNLFLSNLLEEDENIIRALQKFVTELKKSKRLSRAIEHLIPEPQYGSACKRLNLFLRWMVRKDEIDLGIWNEVGTHRLLMPVDVHVHRISLALGLVNRRSCDLKFSLQLTERLKQFDTIDPVKYDFALCHIGIDGKERSGDLSERAKGKPEREFVSGGIKRGRKIDKR